MKHLQIILASTRKGRMGEAVAQWTQKIVAENKNFSVELVDLAEYPLPGVDSDVSPVAGVTAAELVTKWSTTVAKADGYIIVSPEYNHGYSGTLKNALDVLKAEWEWKPVSIVGYGGVAGGARSMEQLRLVLIELKMRPTYSSVLLPMIWEALNEQGEPKHPGAEKQLTAVIEEMGTLLA